MVVMQCQYLLYIFICIYLVLQIFKSVTLSVFKPTWKKKTLLPLMQFFFILPYGIPFQMHTSSLNPVNFSDKLSKIK